MKKYKLLLSIAAVLILVGCATAYKPKGFYGGYSETQLDATTVRVTFEGNGYSSRSMVENYLIYRAAEVTLNCGFDWFTVNEREGETDWHPQYGNVGITTTALIKMHRGVKPESSARGFDAKSVISTMGPKIKR